MPTVDISNKICIYCNETKDITLFVKKTNGCKKCKHKKELERHHTKMLDPIYRERKRILSEKAKRKKGVKKMNVRNWYTKEQLIEITKLCQSCNTEKTLNYFRKSNRNGLYSPYGSTCQSCYSKDNLVRQKAWYSLKNDPIRKEKYYKQIAANRQNNPDKFKAIDKKKYDAVKKDAVKYQKQLEAVKLAHKKYNYNHLDKAYSIRKSENLYDSYVVNQLVKNKTGLSVKDVPPELIELKRKQLILTRKIKNNAKNQSSDNNHQDSNN
jgi:hypothetical protein